MFLTVDLCARHGDLLTARCCRNLGAFVDVAPFQSVQNPFRDQQRVVGHCAGSSDQVWDGLGSQLPAKLPARQSQWQLQPAGE